MYDTEMLSMFQTIKTKLAKQYNSTEKNHQYIDKKWYCKFQNCNRTVRNTQ